jgi:hypothetical protein
MVKDTNKDESKASGGYARAKALTKEQRSEIARKAASARWDMIKATHGGNLQVGGNEIPCAVLEDGTRVLSRIEFIKAIGRRGLPSGGRKFDKEFEVPVFLAADNLKPFISNELKQNLKPVLFKPLSGSRGGVSIGYKAELLPQVCNVFLEASDVPGVLRANQLHIVEQCKILIRAFATVGIIALVDEATGYQYDRARHALVDILEHFVAKELRKWVKTFPDEFYEQICRLKGWKLADINKRGAVFGRMTNYLVYKRLAPGVLRELQRLTPKDEKGRRKHKYFQRLTEDIGHPRLRELLASEITLMRIFDDGQWDSFMQAITRAIPIYGDLPLFDELDFNEDSTGIIAIHREDQ